MELVLKECQESLLSPLEEGSFPFITLGVEGMYIVHTRGVWFPSCRGLCYDGYGKWFWSQRDLCSKLTLPLSGSVNLEELMSLLLLQFPLQ